MKTKNMNQQIVDYLQTNKDEYTKESLMEQLRNVGYSELDIAEAVSVVYDRRNDVTQVMTKASFWERVESVSVVVYIALHIWSLMVYGLGFLIIPLFVVMANSNPEDPSLFFIVVYVSYPIAILISWIAFFVSRFVFKSKYTKKWLWLSIAYAVLVGLLTFASMMETAFG